MNIIATDIVGAPVLEPRVLKDAKGFLMELYQANRYGPPSVFVQDSPSCSAKGVLRVPHIQNPNVQGKLVTVLTGAVLDVAVDVRLGSPTFGRHFKVVQDNQNR